VEAKSLEAAVTDKNPLLFSPLRLRELTFRNRIFVSPMCQYSADDGVPGDWHLVHLGSRAVGGAALVMAEATAVSPEGRISPGDTGLWNESQVRAFARITDFIFRHGAVPAIQLAHAGRKASTAAPWEGGKPLRLPHSWATFAPSARPFDPEHDVPRAMTADDIAKVEADFATATEHARQAGFQVVEIHMAHGYLLHEFLSPLTNFRADEYGGDLANRMRLPLRVAGRVRSLWPPEWPVFVRVSVSDWKEGGWDAQQTVVLVRELKKIGIDLIDCSSGGAVPDVKIPVKPGYQVPFAAQVRREAGIATGAVGLIREAHQAEDILASAQADAVFIARELLRDPYWPLHAAQILGVDVPWPQQYERAKPR
jgi:2,4-dienoyl-CoA reductase-like NADH-dependent reductase (Old Yellow Enzyme family)